MLFLQKVISLNIYKFEKKHGTKSTIMYSRKINIRFRDIIIKICIDSIIE